jgi:hypothetical protein
VLHARAQLIVYSSFRVADGPAITQRKRVLYEQVTSVKVFPFSGPLLLLLSLHCMLLSTGFVFAL